MTEIATRARFDRIRYAQVWEDADILVEALNPQPGQTVVSIASAGDNALALLATGARVIAVDLNPAQLACVRLRINAYRHLSHDELLQLIGSRPSSHRAQLLDRAARDLPEADAALWKSLEDQVGQHGAGGVGKFERYFRIFRTKVLPWVHNRRTVTSLLNPKTREERETFYDQHWNSRRWQWMLKAFFSRFTMARLGRDPAFFEHAQGSLSDQVARLTRRALVEQDPSRNPYLHWILTGQHGEALPRALRAGHFDTIRDALPRLELRLCTIEELAGQDIQADACNLSDIFEYMSPDAHHEAYNSVIALCRPGARLAYWNMMVPRHAPPAFAERVRPLDVSQLRLADKAFFYNDFVVEQVLG